MNLVTNAQLHRTQQSASLILISRSASAPRGRAVWRGGREGRSAECSGDPGRRGPRPALSCSPAAESAREAALRLARRTRAPRLGASSCSAAAAATSSPAARAWRLQGLGQHFPAVSHTPLCERGLWHTRTQPQTSRSLGKIKNSGIRAKGVAQEKARQRCADLGVPSERQPREGQAGAGGARPTQFVRRSPSARRPSRPDWHPWR